MDCESGSNGLSREREGCRAVVGYNLRSELHKMWHFPRVLEFMLACGKHLAE